MLKKICCYLLIFIITACRQGAVPAPAGKPNTPSVTPVSVTEPETAPYAAPSMPAPGAPVITPVPGPVPDEQDESAARLERKISRLESMVGGFSEKYKGKEDKPETQIKNRDARPHMVVKGLSTTLPKELCKAGLDEKQLVDLISGQEVKDILKDALSKADGNSLLFANADVPAQDKVVFEKIKLINDFVSECADNPLLFQLLCTAANIQGVECKIVKEKAKDRPAVIIGGKCYIISDNGFELLK
jgi:hypothetical protein